MQRMRWLLTVESAGLEKVEVVGGGGGEVVGGGGGERLWRRESSLDARL